MGTPHGNPAWEPCMGILYGNPVWEPSMGTLYGNPSWEPHTLPLTPQTGHDPFSPVLEDKFLSLLLSVLQVLFSAQRFL